MALWGKNMQFTPEEKQRRIEKRENDIVRRNSFYTGEKCSQPNEQIESASNRRAAGKFVPNF